MSGPAEHDAPDSAAGPPMPRPEPVEQAEEGQRDATQQAQVAASMIRSMTNMSWSESSFFSGKRNICSRILYSPRFDAMMGCIIIANSITIGLEQSFTLAGRSTRFITVMEHFFIFMYGSELSLRIHVQGWKCFEDHWVKFDALLVFLGVTTSWILEPALGHVEGLGPVLVLRTARLFRLARAVRLLIKFRELWMLVQGLMNSASTMLYTLLMLIVVLYIFSSIAIEIITRHPLARGDNADPEFQEIVTEFFGSLPNTMLTLLQFVTLDSMNVIYRPIIKKDWWLGIYFVALILVVSIALMNLVTAVVVESALQQAMKDNVMVQQQRKKERKKFVHHLKKIFQRLDEDGSGEVTPDEISNMDQSDKQEMANILGINDPNEIFSMLDVDKSGSLGIDEFCDGVLQYVDSAGSLDMKRLEKKLDHIKWRMDAFETCQMDLCKSLKLTTGPKRGHRGSARSCVEPTEQDMPIWAAELRKEMRAQSENIACNLHRILNGEVGPCPTAKSTEVVCRNPSAHDGSTVLEERKVALHQQLMTIEKTLFQVLHGRRLPEAGDEWPARAKNNCLRLKPTERSALGTQPKWERTYSEPLSPTLRKDTAFASRPQSPPASSRTILATYRSLTAELSQVPEHVPERRESL